MGSMTGAPKKRVMEIIERYEQTKRGLFSGAIGYIDPEGDADFNVVIRSILYNATAKYVSFQAGSAITFYSDAGRRIQGMFVESRSDEAGAGDVSVSGSFLFFWFSGNASYLRVQLAPLNNTCTDSFSIGVFVGNK